MSSEMQEAIQTFIAEAAELLQEMEDGLLFLEDSPNDDEVINSVFRAVHTIKGSSGVFGFDYVVEFTHVVETVLDGVRNGDVDIDADLTALLLRCGDQMATLVAFAAESDGEDGVDEVVLQAGRDLHEGLFEYIDNPAGQGESSVETALLADGNDTADVGTDLVTTDNWHISVYFGADVLRNGMDPLSFLRYLNKVGEIVYISTRCKGLPEFDSMDAESCYLGFEIDFSCDADKTEIEQVFNFVADDCELRIIPPRSNIQLYRELIASLESEDMMIGEILIMGGALTQRELGLALEVQQSTDTGFHHEHPRIGDVLVNEGVVDRGTVDVAVEKQNATREIKAAGAKSMRVDAVKLDQLVNLVGELVIASARSSLLAQKYIDDDLFEANATSARLVEEIRDQSMRLRMVNIGETFNRFKRVVRDMSSDLGKDIRLEMSGEDSELDKTVVEKLADPLMHLVRNSMDHGIESAELRAAAGKPVHGTIYLDAYHDSGSIIIEVSDDGAGLNKEYIYAKAVKLGMLEADEEVSDDVLYRLIFEPGFSTAQQVSNISGRGVGMDVVNKNITALRGSVEIDSRLGQGTTIRIRLPLTLAIIDGFLVGVGESSYVVPTDMIVECLEIPKQDHHSDGDNNYINLRGEVLPYVRLGDMFGEPDREIRHENILVVQHAGKKAGLMVDELLGEFQTVIKPLDKMFQELQGVSGATILGSGDVAVILDVPSLIATMAASKSGPGLASASSMTH